MKISVFGLGYVGMVNIACFSKLGHTVYGCDIKQHKVDILKSGRSTVFEPGISEIVDASHREGRIIATTDARECVTNSDLALVCVGTPSDSTGNVNLNYILNTTREIVSILSKANKPFTIVFRSTIPPGTIENSIIPAITPYLIKAAHKPNVVFLPEFLREGNAVKDFFECARVVVGIDEEENGKAQLSELFSFDEKIPVYFTGYRTAEFVKYVDNAYHAVKVAFSNEIYSVGAKMGADVAVANELFLLDDILNISKKYLVPGMPFGGSCLPKDTRALIHMGIENKVETPLIKGVFESNSAHQQRILEKVMGLNKDQILIYGITFKQNTDDIRESPFIALLESLVKAGKQVKVYDQAVNITSMRIEFPHLVQYIYDDLDALVEWSDLVVLNNKHCDGVLEKANASTAILNCLNNDRLQSEAAEIHYLY